MCCCLRFPNANPASSVPNTDIKLMPFAANDISRYENRPFVSCPWLRGDWELCVHPEGVLYLHNNRKSVFTEATMDSNMFGFLDKFVDALDELAQTQSVNLGDDNVDLVVQLAQNEEGEVSCYYYFVDHTDRILFWLHDRDQATDDIFSGLQGVMDSSHIRYSLESEYWTHCESYPKHQMDRPKIIKELRELVMHASAEIITSDTSLSPFDGDELSRILELINHLKENALDNDPHSTCVIDRAKFFNFCGLPCARLEADKSVYKDDENPHPLTSMWVDECINTPRWKDFNKNLMTEWTGITIYSSVMLAVDVSFLAVPNVYIGQSQSIGIIVTYLSIIFITGSLIVSVLLVRQNQRYGFESADKATDFLSHMTGTFFGVRALATVHSLPYAMLMWG
ncbi:uncharacterized protein F5891DRAFT_1068603 [Suillus fuscotomentosus]|uniref:Uncharacterized protein n=1 Tax=Suillus fuscotomentosus TaxID=1912939 RepID=A0AAD4DU41_9AGAM|nr:uncharacterized protein F5891DRAFT_1068603 [Suillus fuscotomentosus]KAG1892878.1 hypothetical protein F5891DRAFT_1068603 [Suillus fuscotomentosus]